MGLVKEFREFAIRGNVMDLAVGVIMGGAFGKIVSSLVGDVLMPPLGLIIGGVDFSSLAVTLKEASAPGAADGVKLMYGKFLQSCFDFAIIAFAVFLLVKAINALKRYQDEAGTGPTAQEKLLMEIRDILKSRN